MKNAIAPRLTSLMFIVVAGTMQPVQAQNMINPLSLLAPAQGNPWSGGYGNISSPFGLGALNPLNPLNSINPLSPWNSYGGLSNPVLSLGALGAINALTPNILPSSNPYSNSLFAGNPFAGNPFAGNAFGGNPYARSAQQPLFGAPAFSPSTPSFPNMPFALQSPQYMMPGGYAGAYYPMQQPVQPAAYPFMPYAAQPQSAPQPQPQASLANLFGAPQQASPSQQTLPSMPNLFGMTAPAPQPKPQATPQPVQQLAPFLPFLPPQATQVPSPQPAQPALEASRSTVPSGPQPSLLPFFLFGPQSAPVAAPAAKPSSEASPEAKAENAAALPPLDPAAFMQTYMKPEK